MSESWAIVGAYAKIQSLFKFLRSVEKRDTNTANTGMIRLWESVNSVLICV